MRGSKGGYGLAGLIVIFLCGFLTLELGAAMEAAAVEVKIVSPSSGSVVSGTVPISLLMKSNAALVKVYVDGAYLASTPGTISWLTNDASNGMHTISAKAYSSTSELLGTSSRSVRVKNRATPTSTPTPTAGP